MDFGNVSGQQRMAASQSLFQRLYWQHVRVPRRRPHQII